MERISGSHKTSLIRNQSIDASDLSQSSRSHPRPSRLIHEDDDESRGQEDFFLAWKETSTVVPDHSTHICSDREVHT
jgi:hypothetical protein